MVHINGLPVLPHRMALNIEWSADGATASAQFDSHRIVGDARLYGDYVSSADDSALTNEEQAQLYTLIAKLFESQRSQEMLRTDEWLATLPPEEVVE